MNKIEIIEGDAVSEEISIRKIVVSISKWVTFLRSKIIIICILGVIIGVLSFAYAFFKKPIYTATLTFALEEERGGNMSGALGIASSLGFDLGGGGASGIFSSSNIMDLMKSRLVVEKSLQRQIQVEGNKMNLGDYYFQHFFYDNKKGGAAKNENKDFSSYKTKREQDSLMNVIYTSIIDGGVLSVFQKDKKVSIISIQVISTDEIFAKEFAESIASEVSTFYIETKSRKARINYEILQRQTDSIRNELNNAVTGVAVANDNTFNLNPALNVKRVVSTKRQIDVQANTAILTQLVANLEMAKVSLRKETPLIQIIDKPRLPLIKSESKKVKNSVIGFLIGVLLSSLFFIVKEKVRQ